MSYCEGKREEGWRTFVRNLLGEFWPLYKKQIKDMLHSAYACGFRDGVSFEQDLNPQPTEPAPVCRSCRVQDRAIKTFCPHCGARQ